MKSLITINLNFVCLTQKLTYLLIDMFWRTKKIPSIQTIQNFFLKTFVFKAKTYELSAK
jgi:hypothetical protein